MPPEILPVSKSLSSIQAFLENAVESIWQNGGRRPKLGLAISGGVDSMAMAKLCSEAAKARGSAPYFTGFIVDHGLRKGSDDEAQTVAQELRQMHIDACVLKLKWKHDDGDGDRSSHLESAARRLRYQALGKACRDRNISSLLVAHHADDQAETVLLRILGNYMGTGLRGIKSEAGIPDCGGIYGVSHSGEPRVHRYLPMYRPPSDRGASNAMHSSMLIEDGGVEILRPLLSFTKEELIAVCRGSGVRWFEDETNVDRSLTLRNTVRDLQRREMLPRAFLRSRLCSTSHRAHQRATEVDLIAEQWFERISISLDTRSCRVTCTIPMTFPEDTKLSVETSYHAKATLLQKLFAIVSPVENIALPDLHNAVPYMFPPVLPTNKEDHSFATQPNIQVAGLIVRRMRGTPSAQRYVFERGPPTAEQLERIVGSLSPVKGFDNMDSLRPTTDWHLWDNRYWIRVGRSGPIPDDGKQILVRFLTKTHIATLRQSLNEGGCKGLKRALAAAPGNLRFSLPAIVVRSQDRSQVDEQVVALPSLGWSVPAWERWPPDGSLPDRSRWFWDIRYRQVHLAETGVHNVTGGGRPAV